MQKPVFRLELLRFLLGLDTRFTLDVLRASLAFALECAHSFPPDAELPCACVEPGVPHLGRLQSSPSLGGQQPPDLATGHSWAGAAGIPLPSKSPPPLRRAASMPA
jgi:hypothetical protein